ncbi:MAG: SDR family oxidoreductase, partial [Gammaproteobacteria bacterium]|nr:SDR family oxidoreductase [Gammaproteobacteria bacterium]
MSDPVVITGVGRRVGLHLAQNFLDRGVPVVGTYRSERPELEKLKDRGADLYYCDFYDEPQITALVNRVVSAHSGLRAIIHNASDWLPDRSEVGPAETMRRMM